MLPLPSLNSRSRWLHRAAALATLAAIALLPAQAEPRWRLIEDFDQLPQLGRGDLRRFTGGYEGWRFNVEERGGRWEVAGGVFRGIEEADDQHPATASYGFPHHDVVVRCEVRLDDVPADGRKYRSLSLRFTDGGGYVCTVRFDEKGLLVEKSDYDRAGPDQAVELARLERPIKLGEWHTLEVRLAGPAFYASLDGTEVGGKHPFIDRPKTTLMFMVQTESSVRRLRIQDAENATPLR